MQGKYEERKGVNRKKLWGLLLLSLLITAVAVYALSGYKQFPVHPEVPSEKHAPLEFFFSESKPVVFDYLQFLDADGNPILVLDFNRSIVEYLSDGWGEPEYWGGDEGWVCTAYGNCSLNINLPRDAHFIRLRAALQPVDPYMEWKELLRNAIRMGVKVNGTITDDGLHANGTDLTKCISNRFWICYYILKPDVDSDKDGTPNCIKIAEKHYRALDLNPRIPEPKPTKSKYNIGVFYNTPWRVIPKWTKRADWKYATVKPIEGPYDCCDPELIDKQIKRALEHGISIFIIAYVKPGWGAEQSFEDGFLRSRYKHLVKYCIDFYSEQWWPGFQFGDSLNKTYQLARDVTNYISTNYFVDSSYLRINNSPAVFLFHMLPFSLSYGLENLTSEEHHLRKALTFM